MTTHTYYLTNLLFMLLPFAFAISVARRALRRGKQTTITRRTTSADIAAILDPSHTSVAQLLHSRAIPNQRLVTALGLTNTFVSQDMVVHKNFTRAARAMIGRANPQNRDTAGWLEWISGVEGNVQHFLPQKSSDFATFVRSVTMGIVLTAFMDANLTALDPNDIAFVTRAINERWAHSKSLSQQGVNPHLLSEINAHIFRWVPDRDLYPNPLDFIIPSFETMWRVSAIALVYANRDINIRRAFIEFAENPTMDEFKTFKDDRPSVEAVIQEVLRLYPPTRRISRAKTSPTTKLPWPLTWFAPHSQTVLEVADIEAYHISERWGDNRLDFDPMRHHPQTENFDLYAFGFGKLKCVAASWAPMAAGALAAHILQRIDNVEFELKEGGEIGGREGWDDWVIQRRA